jgi:hypothetical protein
MTTMRPEKPAPCLPLQPPRRATHKHPRDPGERADLVVKGTRDDHIDAMYLYQRRGAPITTDERPRTHVTLYPQLQALT